MYFPEEDSFLLTNVLKKNISDFIDKNKETSFLEIGCGTGIQLKTALNSGVQLKNIFAVDINPKAVKYCEDLGFNCILSDLFSKIEKKRKFDLIVFNPPYLPLDKNEPIESQRETTGGKKGSEIINNFLIQVKKYLKEKGNIFLVTSSLTKAINWQDWKKTKVAEKKLFFEKIYVWKLEK